MIIRIFYVPLYKGVMKLQIFSTTFIYSVMRISIFENKKVQLYSDYEACMEVVFVIAVCLFMVGVVWLCALAHPALAFTMGALMLAGACAIAILYLKGKAMLESEGNSDDRQQS